MKIEKRIYKVIYKGKKFSLPVFSVYGVFLRERVFVYKKEVIVIPVKSR